MTVILGAGLTGLAAAHLLAEKGLPCTVLENQASIGGLARTVEHNGFRFDLGGHRFLTDLPEITALMERLFGDELLTVPRKSQILNNGRVINYPLSPSDAVFTMGPAVSAKIVADFLKEKITALVHKKKIVSLEDWVVRQFGRTMFTLYFRDYSEKVWGIPCHTISRDWVATRIDNLSLWRTLTASLSKVTRLRAGRRYKTLTDSFLYPARGIGEIADRLAAAARPHCRIATSATIQAINHDNGVLRSCVVQHPDGNHEILPIDQCISTMPLPTLLGLLRPRPPAGLILPLPRLSYRALLLVTVMLDRPQVTDQTWLYLPEKEVPFGRIHEPGNWSRAMAPAGKSHLVIEYFCTQDDELWNSADGPLIDRTVRELARLGLIKTKEATDACVVRVPYAYPLFDTSYQEELGTIEKYLAGFENLTLAGRTGAFQYLNMDRALAAGRAAGRKVLAGTYLKPQAPKERLAPVSTQQAWTRREVRNRSPGRSPKHQKPPDYKRSTVPQIRASGPAPRTPCT